MFTVGSLYAGVGGICLGLINSGFKVLWANEYDKYACKTYRLNFEHTLYEEDVWKLEPEELKKVDVLAAGFPCQAFSVAGYRKGFEDERGNHFFRVMKYVEVIKPKVIFLENVKNLKGHDKGKTFRVIEEAILAAGYSIQYAVLNTMLYGNVPQNRERVYIICFKNSKNGINTFSKFFRFPGKIEPTVKLANVINHNKVEERFYYREDKYMFEELAKHIKRDDTLYQWRRQYVRENKSNVCPTLTANMGTGGHNVPLVKTKYGIRKLTPSECFQLQGFPKNFKFPEDVPVSQLYKQAGNSVSVPVIQRIGGNILKALNGEQCEIDDYEFKSMAKINYSLFGTGGK